MARTLACPPPPGPPIKEEQLISGTPALDSVVSYGAGNPYNAMSDVQFGDGPAADSAARFQDALANAAQARNNGRDDPGGSGFSLAAAPGQDSTFQSTRDISRAPAMDVLSTSANGPDRTTDRTHDAGHPLPNLPVPPGPGNPPVPGQGSTIATPGCHGFESAARRGGELAGGTLEGLRQAGPGALKGGALGAMAGAGQGLIIGTGTGALAGGVGAVPGAATGMVAGALRGSVAGAVAGGAPGFVKGFGEGAGPGAAAGMDAGSWLDDSRLGRWVQNCPAPEARTVDGAQGSTVMHSEGADGSEGKLKSF